MAAARVELGAHDLATDLDPDDSEFTEWAEQKHGARAREFIVALDALQRIRTADH